jgi:plastocyanin
MPSFLSSRVFKRSRSIGLFVAAISLVCLSGTISESNVQAKTKATTAIVTIEAFQFMPAEITVKKGSIVTFVNKDETPHTADPDSGKGFTGSGRLKAGQSKAIVFNTVGTQAYHCAIHPSMVGKVIVK